MDQTKDLEALLESVRRIVRERDDAWARVRQLEKQVGDMEDALYEAAKGKVA